MTIDSPVTNYENLIRSNIESGYLEYTSKRMGLGQMRTLAFAKWRTFPSVKMISIFEQMPQNKIDSFVIAYSDMQNNKHKEIFADYLVEAFSKSTSLWESIQSDFDRIIDDVAEEHTKSAY